MLNETVASMLQATSRSKWEPVRIQPLLRLLGYSDIKMYMLCLNYNTIKIHVYKTKNRVHNRVSEKTHAVVL